MGIKFVGVREVQVANALFPLMKHNREATIDFIGTVTQSGELSVTQTLQLGDVAIELRRKKVKHVRLSVHSLDGRVTLTVPLAMGTEVARAFAASRLHWIHIQQQKLRAQPRETLQQFVEGENHYLWGQHYPLAVQYKNAKPSVVLKGKQIVMTVRPGATLEKRAQVMHDWHKMLLHAAIPPLLETWQDKLDVKVTAYFLQRMKTRWGSCNYRAGRIRLNTELVKKPRNLLEYVIVHELAHLIEPTHNARFVAVMDTHYPSWRNAHAELNALPLPATK